MKRSTRNQKNNDSTIVYQIRFRTVKKKHFPPKKQKREVFFYKKNFPTYIGILSKEEKDKNFLLYKHFNYFKEAFLTSSGSRNT